MPNGGRWEVGPMHLDLTDLGKQVFGVESLVRMRIPTAFLDLCRLAFIEHSRDAQRSRPRCSTDIPPPWFNASVDESRHGPVLTLI